MAKDKKKNDKAKSEKPKKQDSKAIKASDSKKAKGDSKKSGPVTEKKPGIFGKLAEYLVGVRAELKRVTWPTREKVIYLVGVVAVTLVFFATFTALVDWGASEGVVGLNYAVHGAPEGGINQVPVQVDLDGMGLDFGGGNDAVVDEGVIGANDDAGADVDADGGVDNDGNGDTDE